MAADTTNSLDTIHSGTLPGQGNDIESMTDIDLGIDLGTTRTVVARADRGNYPVLSFGDENGDENDFIPSLTALRDGELVHGFAARQAARRGTPLLRSLKRALAAPTLTASTPVRLGEQSFSVLEVLTSYLRHVKAELEKQNVSVDRARVVVAVPAHAYGAQRLLTLEAFQQAGFRVAAMLNEPSAAGFEYTHRKATTVSSRRTRVLVYDLGGGTFDQRLYSFRDILVLKVVKRLLDTGVSLQQIRTAVSALHSRGVEDLASITLMSDGASVYECTSADEVVDLVAGGQGVFGIAVGRVWHEVEGALADLPVDHAQALGTPLVEDELAKRRAAKRQQAI